MSVYEDYIDSLNIQQRAVFNSWFSHRPPVIQALIRQHPPGTMRMIHGRLAWLMSYAEMKDGPPSVSFTHINPFVDYDKAFSARFTVCSSCLDDIDSEEDE